MKWRVASGEWRLTVVLWIQEICLLRTVGCVNVECDWTGTMIDSDQHELECGYTQVDCTRKPDCQAVVLRKDQKQHDNLCTAYRYALTPPIPIQSQQKLSLSRRFVQVRLLRRRRMPLHRQPRSFQDSPPLLRGTACSAGRDRQPG